MSSPAATRAVHLVRTMGTVISLDVRTADPAAAQPALAAAERLLHQVDAAFSTYREDSWISRLARREVASRALPSDVLDVLGLCAEVEQLTDGWFTARWSGTGTLDPTGLVKGWAAERAGRLLAAHGLVDHCVNAAGDVALSGRPAAAHGWRVGIADPRGNGLLGVVDGPAEGTWAVATSGTAERGAHVLDPRTGRPADAVLSATVVGPSPALADGLATALVAAGADAGALLDRLRGAGWTGCVLRSDGALLDPDGLLVERAQDPGASSLRA